MQLNCGADAQQTGTQTSRAAHLTAVHMLKTWHVPAGWRPVAVMIQNCAEQQPEPDPEPARPGAARLAGSIAQLPHVHGLHCAC